MEKFKKLNDFVEGRLRGASEKEFLGELASDDELRSEMKRLLAVNSTIRNNRKLFSVPENSKSAIFGAIGISGASTVASGGMTSFWNKITNGVLLVGATVAVAILLLWGLHEDLGLTRLSNLEDIISEKSALQSAYNTQNDKFTAMLRENSSLKEQYDDLTAHLANINAAEREIIYKTVFVDRYPESPNDNSNTEQYFSRNDISNSQLEQVSHLYISDLQSTNNDKSIKMPQYQSSLWNEEADIYQSNSKSFSIELNKYEFIDIDNVNVPAGNDQMFNNTGLVFGYRLSNNLKLSAEIRRESFDLAFDGYDDLGQYQQFKSIANFNTYTLGAEYRFLTGTKIVPEVDVSLGGNKVGVVPRLGTSLTYELSDNFNLSLRGELSAMYFEFNGSGFFSNKAGISYGIEYIIK